MRRILYWLPPCALLLAFFLQGRSFIASNSQTFDEAVHLTAGYSYIAKGDFRLNAEHPPLIKFLCALPVYVRYRIPFEPDAEWWEKAKERATGDEAQWVLSKEFFDSSP